MLLRADAGPSSLAEERGGRGLVGALDAPASGLSNGAAESTLAPVLALRRPTPTERVRWADDVVDNENAGKKKSKSKEKSVGKRTDVVQA